MPSSSPAAPQTKVLFVTPECAPLVKTGGLGDVSAALPPALRGQGVDARTLLPGYRAVLDAVPGAREIARVRVLGHDVRLLEGRLASGVPLFVADCPALYARGGGPYQTDGGKDWEDNAIRFGVLSKLAALLGTEASPIEWRPDVVHCNDWPVALAPVYLWHDEGRRAASLLTIHNLAFQGVFPRTELPRLELPAKAVGIDGVEYYGQVSFLKGGLICADAINTVSPTYAREIQGETLGFGLDGVLRMRSDRLYGVLNGIDTAVWSPESDALIPTAYGASTLDRKPLNRKALRVRMGLDPTSERPVAGMVSRLTHQKGIDLLTDAADGLVAMGWDVAVVGTGERELQEKLEAAAARHPGKFATFLGFDESVAHLVEAGADVFLMPSRFEPCGMNQMYSQRYGTPPVVNPTGGLVDTVTEKDGEQTGFLMRQATAAGLDEACSRALKAIRDPKRWRQIQLNGMSRDFGWDSAARKYREIYDRIVIPA